MSAERVVRVPGDKSISHRALLLAALARGRSRVAGVLDSADIQSTADALRALGAAVPPLAPSVEIEGRGLRGLRRAERSLDCGNSGTTARLVAGIAAGHPFATQFVGDESLSRRPMRRVARPLEAMGARFEFARGDGLPMTVHGGALRPVDWRPEAASAQVKSAVLLAGLVAGVPVSVREPRLSRDHTERMLAAMGASVTVEEEVRLAPIDALAPLVLRVPGDPSSAAYFVALAALGRDTTVLLPDVCLNDTRLGFVRALESMGARVSVEATSVEGGELVGVVRAAPSSLHGIDPPAEAVPSLIDELPLLACVAARAEGTTTVSGAAELRVKESDRIAAVVGNLRAIGVTAEERADGFAIAAAAGPLRGRVRTFGDHRIAMSFGVLASLPGNDIMIDDRACVAVSYPNFWADLGALASR